jgi:long-chain acyl-CoA synthetase
MFDVHLYCLKKLKFRGLLMGLHDITFYDVITRNARNYRQNQAWYEVDDGRSLTFGEFKHTVDRLAGGLFNAGVRYGDRIGLLGKNSLEFFQLYGAAAAIGAIVLPINWRLSAEEVCFNLNDCNPKVLFVDAEYQSMIFDHKADLPGVREIFNLKGDKGRFRAYSELMRSEPIDRHIAATVGAHDGFIIIHTAAVAGRPRGALLSHDNVLCSNMHLMQLFGTTADDANLGLLPLFHIAGLVMATCVFHAGGTNLNMSKFDAETAVDLIETRGASLIFDFAPILGSILEAAETSGRNVHNLRGVLGLDTPETIEKYQNMTGGTFYSMYGQTETSCIATHGPYDERPGAAGRTIELADVRLFNDNDEPVPTGEVGEIAVRGPVVFKGYWNLPEDNAYTFREGWHHTGDLGRFDEEGFLFYEGRKAEKELIKPGGENVYPAEVEAVILQHPAVAQTVVFGIPDPKWKEAIKAVCRLKSGQSLEAAELIEFVGSRIARYKKPQVVQFIDKMPLLKDGSPDREAVKKAYGGQQK